MAALTVQIYNERGQLLVSHNVEASTKAEALEKAAAVQGALDQNGDDDAR